MIFRMIRTCTGNSASISALVVLLLWSCAAPIWQSVDLAKRQGDTAKIETLLAAHVQKNPGDAKAFFMLGEIRGELGRWQGMMSAFDACEKIDPAWRRDVNSKKELFWRKNFNDGVIARQLGDTDESLVNFAAITIIYPERAIGHRLFGEASLAFGDTAQALGAFEQALSLHFDDHISRRHMMALSFAQNYFEQALEQAEILLMALPHDPEALRFRAYSLDMLDRRHEATDAYTKLIAASEDPADVESFAAFKYRMGLYEDAIALSELAITRGGDREANWQAIVQARLMQQNYPELLAAASTLSAIAPNNLQAYELKQLAQITLGQVRQARLTKLDYLHALAQIRLKQRLFPELLATTDEILSIRENDLEALRLRAATFDSTREYRKAREAQLLYLDVLGKKQWEEHNFLEVIRTTAQTLAIDSTNFQAVQLKKSAYDSLGQPQDALQTEITYHAAVARTHLANRNFYGFLKKAMDILALDPKNLMALRYKAMAHDSLGQFQQAGLSEMQYLLTAAEQHLANGDYEAVIRETDKALDLDRNNREAVQLKIAAHRQLDQNDQAKQTEIAYQLTRIDHWLKDGNGTAAAEDGVAKYEFVLAATDTILTLDPQSVPALEHRKSAFAALGQSRKAVSTEIELLLILAQQRLGEKNYQELLKLSDEIIAIDASYLPALNLKKIALQHLGQDDAARKIEITSLLLIADSLSAQNDQAELLKVATTILALDRLNKNAVDLKHAAHLALGQKQLAEQTMIKYWLELAAHRMQQKKYAEVHELVDQVLSAQPSNLEALTLKRNAYLATARLDEALALKQQIELLQSKK